MEGTIPGRWSGGWPRTQPLQGITDTKNSTLKTFCKRTMPLDQIQFFVLFLYSWITKTYSFPVPYVISYFLGSEIEKPAYIHCRMRRLYGGGGRTCVCVASTVINGTECSWAMAGLTLGTGLTLMLKWYRKTSGSWSMRWLENCWLVMAWWATSFIEHAAVIKSLTHELKECHEDIYETLVQFYKLKGDGFL